MSVLSNFSEKEKTKRELVSRLALIAEKIEITREGFILIKSGLYLENILRHTTIDEMVDIFIYQQKLEESTKQIILELAEKYTKK